MFIFFPLALLRCFSVEGEGYNYTVTREVIKTFIGKKLHTLDAEDFKRLKKLKNDDKAYVIFAFFCHEKQ